MNEPLAYGSPESVGRREGRLRVWRIAGIVAIVLIILGNIAWAQYVTETINREWAPVITVTDPKLIGSATLCPGDSLSFEYALHSEGSDGIAIIDVDISVWSEMPPQTAIYSRPERAILFGATDTTVRTEWPQPDDVLAHELLASRSGNYELRLAFRNVYEAKRPVGIRVPFTIASDCP